MRKQCYRRTSSANFRGTSHCVKSIQIRSFSGQYFPAFWLNTERYSVKSLRIQYKCAKIQTRKPRIWTFFTQFLREPVPTRTLMCSSMASRWGKLRILEPVKHLTKNTQYGYNWTILANTSKHARTIKNLKARYIALLKLSLNDQLKSRNCSFLEMG